MITWYGRDGQELNPRNAEKLLADPAYKTVAFDAVGPYRVSTVWLGLDHRWDGKGPPIIFETLVFTEVLEEDADDDFADAYPMADYMRRYETEEEALLGHSEIMSMCEEHG